MGTQLVWTQAKYETAIRNTAGDPAGANTTRWSQTEIEDYGNRALNQVCLDTEALIETSWTIAAVATQSEYELPKNFVRDKVVEWIESTSDIRRLQYMTMEEYNMTRSRNPTVANIPQWYWIWRRLGTDETDYQASSIHFYPTPNATNSIRIWGYKLPDAVDFSDNGTLSMELEAPHMEAAVLYCRFLMKLDDDDGVEANRTMALYKDQVEKIMGWQTPRSRSGPSILRPRDSTFTGSRRWGVPVMPWQRGY